MNIKTNDTVVILSGKDKGKTGKVLAVNPKKGRVLVEGRNMMTKTIKRRSEQEVGGISTQEGPLDISKVALVVKGGTPTRIGFKMEGDKKVRYSKKTGEAL